MPLNTTRRGLLLTGALLMLSGCEHEFMTDYEPLSGAAASYRVVKINVTVPQSLTVSEDEFGFIPNADIVWREEPEGDRYAQVQRIFEEGAAIGIRGMRGRQPVVMNITVEKFHALNNHARWDAPATIGGVYDIRFTAELVDAKTGRVVVPIQQIAGDLRANTGSDAHEEEKNGITERQINVAQIGATIAGWLGTGPDNRNHFRNMGG